MLLVTLNDATDMVLIFTDLSQHTSIALVDFGLNNDVLEAFLDRCQATLGTVQSFLALDRFCLHVP